MKRVVEEQLSAFFDDELPPEELELLLRRFQSDPDLRRTIERYALIGAMARGEAVGLPSLQGRIGEALREEEPHEAPSETPLWMTRAGRSVIGTSVAAAVAVAAILTLDVGLGPTPDGQPVAELEVVTEPVSYTVPAATTNAPIIPAARLTNYLVAHGEYATTFSRKAIDSRIVARAADDDSEEAVDEIPEGDREP